MRLSGSCRVVLTLLLAIGVAVPPTVSFAQSPSERPPLDRPPPPPPPPGQPWPTDRPPPPPRDQLEPRDSVLGQDAPPPTADMAAPPPMPPDSSVPANGSATAASAPTPDAAELQLRDARQNNDPELLGSALLNLADVRMGQAQPRAALPALEEAVALANRTGNDRLGREAAKAMAAAYDMLGDTAMGDTWRAHADEYRERMAGRVAPPAPADDAMDAAATDSAIGNTAPAATERNPGSAVTSKTEFPRWPGWLALLCVVLGVAWWQASRHAARLSSEADALARQQRHLRYAHQNLKNQTEQYRQMAVQDSLTGTMNRQAFAAGLDSLLRHAVPFEKPVALFVFDLDHFKTINDRHGHLAGDAALKLVVGVVQEKLQSEDLFGRFGGDEFLIACFGLDRERAYRLGENIRAAVVERAKSETATPMPELSISMGIAHATPASGYDLESLFARADTALYAAKRAGRNQVVLEDETLPPPPKDQPALRSLSATSHEV